MTTCAFWADWREIPDGHGELGVLWKSGIIDRQLQPFVPGSGSLEVLVWGLGVNSERLAIGE